jgi:TfoX/Sxy family transcriptional regulator of competence genes
MFGEYGFHLDGKFIALACENSFFIKEEESWHYTGSGGAWL